MTDFDLHLSLCAQCADHPFELCPLGDVLIVEAAARVGLKFKPKEDSTDEQHA